MVGAISTFSGGFDDDCDWQAVRDVATSINMSGLPRFVCRFILVSYVGGTTSGQRQGGIANFRHAAKHNLL